MDAQSVFSIIVFLVLSARSCERKKPWVDLLYATYYVNIFSSILKWNILFLVLMANDLN